VLVVRAIDFVISELEQHEVVDTFMSSAFNSGLEWFIWL
jgi:hypothetical protein